MATHTYKVTTTNTDFTVEADQVDVGPTGATLRKGDELVAFVAPDALISVQRTTATPAGDG